jgi:uncharacterized protein (TIGR00369 family)
MAVTMIAGVSRAVQAEVVRWQLSIPATPLTRVGFARAFARQGHMHTLSASLESVPSGLVEIALTPGSAVSRQHGFVHAGALAAIADSAAGYAALSLMPPGAGVLTTEFKINLLAPAAGERILARGRVIKAGRTGRVIKAGRTLTLAQTEVFSQTAGEEKLVALLTATLMTVEGQEGIND